MKLYSLLYILLFSYTALSAQDSTAAFSNGLTQSVRGQVIDKNSKLPVEGAVVSVESTNLSSSTDAKGYFKLKNVPVGRQTIIISSSSHGSMTLANQEVKSGKELYLEIEMEEKIITADEIKIVRKSSTKAENEAVVNSNVNLTPKQTERFAGSLNDVSRMAMNYAGVISSSDNRNDIIIRGNSPSGILWRLNGINIPNPNHFGSLGSTGGPITILNNNNLAKSDFMTGAFPADYGNAVAGAFDLKLRHGNNEKFEGTGMFGFNGMELGAEGPFSKKSKASYMANYRYSTLGIFDALGISFGVAAVPQYQDLTFNVDIPLGQKSGRLEIFGVGGMSNISILESKKKKENDVSYTQAGSNAYLNSNMGVVGISYLLYLNQKTHMRLVYATSGTGQVVRTDSLDKDKLNPGKIYEDNSSEIKYSLNWYINTKFSSRNSWKSGFIVDLYHVSYNEKFLSNSKWFTGYDFTGETFLVQGYSQFQHKFTDQLKLNVGLHYQTLTMNAAYAVEPRAGLNWDLTKKQSLSLAAGVHSQIQPFSTYLLETTLSDNSTIRTNEKLGFTKSNHLVLGYNIAIKANTRMKIESYYQQVYNTPVAQNSYFSMANFGADFAFPRVDSLVNEGKGRNYGLEFTLERNFNKCYYYLVSASLYDSKYSGGDGVERNTAFNGNYAVNALSGFEWKVGKRGVLQVDAKVTFAGGKRYLGIDLNRSIAATRVQYDTTDIYVHKFHDYFRADLKASYRLNSKKITQEWTINVQNIFNTQNVFQQIYDNSAKAVKTEYQLGLFPVGSYKILF
ncbi:MAG: carboxypeptidase-like regulatory domain-containing protein [Bacteroidetes bacterium]|nr:carboxypeptidase-like regulatory domain-containing protein [Bacteroidota bacterium]